MQKNLTVMVVDPVRAHLGRSKHHLVNSDFKVLCAESGRNALECLEKTRVDVILWDADTLDMPAVDAISALKENPDTRHIPIIVQRLNWNEIDALNTLRAGAYFYLRKSFNFSLFRAIVEAAISDPNHEVRPVPRDRDLSINQRLLVATRFNFRTLDETKEIANFVASTCEDVDRLQVGLWEIMLNAVEHGNLGISYGEKSRLVDDGLWDVEIKRRLCEPEHVNRFATLECARQDGCLVFNIRDQGSGFDREPYMRISKSRAVDPHGRGIALAASISFSKIQFLGDGNEVQCWFEDTLNGSTP